MAGMLTNDTQAIVHNGLRPINPNTDLVALADLMEVGFGTTMDESGRAMLREMRALGRSGWLARLVNGLDGLFGGFQQGYVWMDNGRMVGNVSVMPALLPRVSGSGVIIANVVVHPDFQRRGIAHELLSASLDLARRQNRRFALLQVAVNNSVAQRLYTQFGFRSQRAFTHWVRPNRLRVPNRLMDMPPFTLRNGRDWQSEYALAQLVRPEARGGMGWLRPTYSGAFQPSFWSGAALLGQSAEHWTLYRSPSDPRQLEMLAVARVQMGFGMPDRFDMLIHPEMQGRLELPLLNFILRRLDVSGRIAVSDHPTDDVAASIALEQYGFEPRRSEMNMRLDFD